MADTELLELETPDLEDALTESEDQQQEAEGQQEEPQTEGEQPKIAAPASLFQADGKKLDPAIKAVLADVKAKSPEAARMVTKALYDLAQVEREFPGGIAEAKELRDAVDGLGGLATVEEKLKDLDFLAGYDDKFSAGDPAFVEGLAEANPEAFSKIAPAVFAKYADIHPDGWKKYIGGIVYGDFQRNEIPVQLTRLGDSIRRKDEAGMAESFNAIAAYLATFKDLAELRVEAPKGQPAQTKTGDIDKREEALRAREWQTEHAGIERRIVQEEYRTALGTRKPSTEEKAQIQELFLAKRQTLARQYFPDQAKKLEQLRQRNDKAGFMRLATVMHKRVTPEAMRWAVSRTLKPAKAAGTQQQQKQRTEPARQQQQQTQNGSGVYKFVGSEPDTYQIDYARTDKKMLSENKAVLKDGSKVQWRDKK